MVWDSNKAKVSAPPLISTFLRVAQRARRGLGERSTGVVVAAYDVLEGVVRAIACVLP